MLDFLPKSSGLITAAKTNIAAAMFVGCDLVQPAGNNPTIVVKDNAGAGTVLFQYEFDGSNSETVELSYPVGTLVPPIEVTLTNVNAVIRYR